MTDRIDCSITSHASCSNIEANPPSAELSRSGDGASSAQRAAASPPPADSQGKATGSSLLRDASGRPLGGASYDCVNDCVSSQGVAVLLSGATVSLGCVMLPPACPVFVGTSVGAILGACEAACENLEAKP